MIRHNYFKSENRAKEKTAKTVFARILSIMLVIGIVCPSIMPIGDVIGASAEEEKITAELVTEYDDTEEETESEEETVSEEETDITDEVNNSEDEIEITEETIDEENTDIAEEIIETIEDIGFQMTMAVNMVRILADENPTSIDFTNKNYGSINLTENGYTVSGNIKQQDIPRYLKMETDTSLSFTTYSSGKLDILFNDYSSKSIKISDGNTEQTKALSSNSEEYQLSAGSYTIKKGSGDPGIKSVSFTPDSQPVDNLPDFPKQGQAYTIQQARVNGKYLSDAKNGSLSLVTTVNNNSSKFMFEAVPNESGKYYIKVLTDNTTVNYLEGFAKDNGNNRGLIVSNKKIGNDVNVERQKFILQQNNDGTYSILAYSDGFDSRVPAISANNDVSVWGYDGIPGNNEKFYITPVDYVEIPDVVSGDPNETPSNANQIRIEARIIYGDYNDDGDHNYNDPSKYRTTFELYKKSDNTAISIKNGNLIEDSTEARKDWCYQYNYIWYRDKLTGNNDGYYIKLSGENNGRITIDGKTYKVYYLSDNELGHPGESTFTGESTLSGYTSNPSDRANNSDMITYIYLDNEKDWQWKAENQPNTINISMKKRWDGHNSGGFNNRPKEKIIVQLQHQKDDGTDDGTWEKYTNNSYYNRFYYTNDEGKTLDLSSIPGYGTTITYDNLFKDNLAEENRLKITVKGVTRDYIVPAGKANAGKYIDKSIIETATRWEKNASDVDSKNRLSLYLSMEDCNDIVLTYGGKNNPQHFTNGYYYNWGDLPYGHYRVVETASFYDTNDNDVFDEGDRDTSQEYYYMEFPPSRDSSGVLHIQNFTKDMVLDVEKEWYDDSGQVIDPNNTHKNVQFEVYRSLEKLDNPTQQDIDNNKLKKIYTETTDNNGQKLMKTTDGNPELLLKNDQDQKYYYYIREVGVDGLSSGQYQIMNANSDGFIRTSTSTANKPVYYADYESGDARKFIIQNKPVNSIKVEKEWYLKKDANGNVSANNLMPYKSIQDLPNAEFEIYKSDRLGTPAKSGTDYKVDDSALTKIGNAVVNADGYFEIIQGDTTSGDNTSKIVSNQLHMYGTEQVYDKNNYGNHGVFSNDTQYPIILSGDSFAFDNGNKRLWIKPAKNVSGTLILTFKNVQSNQKFEVWNKTVGNGVIVEETDFSNYQSGSTVEISYPLIADGEHQGNFRLRRTGGSPEITSAVFYPYNYYYIREVGAENSETFELVNGDANGFVKFSESGDKYYTDLVADKTPSFIAKNVPKMELTLNKEWYANESSKLSVDALNKIADAQKTAEFKIYKSYSNLTDFKEENSLNQVTDITNVDLESLGLNNGVITLLGNNTGKIKNLPAYEEDNGIYKKLYYYVKEVSSNNKYKLITENVDGFIKDSAGNYGACFDEKNESVNNGTVRTYNFKNYPVINLTVKKDWDGKEEKHTDDTVCVNIMMKDSNNNNDCVSISSDNQVNDTPSAASFNADSSGIPTEFSYRITSLGDFKNVKASMADDETVSDVVSKTPSLMAKATQAPIGKYEIKTDSDWQTHITLPAFDASGNPIYYYAEETAVYHNGNENDDIITSFDITYSVNNNTITITNKDKKVILPETGGRGKWIYTVLGMAIMLTSCGISYVMIRRRIRKNDSAA